MGRVPTFICGRLQVQILPGQLESSTSKLGWTAPRGRLSPDHRLDREASAGRLESFGVATAQWTLV